MDRDNLLQMLNIKPTQAKAQDPVAFEQEGQSPTALPTDTALELDEWDRARGKACLESSPKAKSTGLGEEAIADFHSSAFLQEPKLVEACTDQQRHTFIKTLLETPDYQRLHQGTQLNDLASEMAATQFAVEYSGLVESEKEHKEKQSKSKKKPDPEKEQRRQELATLRAVGKAVSQAQEEVDKLHDDMAALGMGPGQGNDNKLPLAQMASLFERIRNSEMLRKIFDAAGRFRLAAQGKQRQKVSHGYADMVGICLDDTLDRLLSEELVLLTEPDLELDTLRRLAERETLAFQYRDEERVGKGPIIICVDESGSMSGEKIHQAKAFALAMAYLARYQGRFCGLIGYSGGTEGTLCVLPPKKWNEAALLDWLEHFYSGGTDMDVPLVELPTKYWTQMGAPKGKTDVILITDAIVNVPEAMVKQFNSWKEKEKVRCISLILAPTAGDLAAVSDEVHLIRSVSITEAGIDKCLSI